MGWGEPHTAGAGTTGDIEEAHQALDGVGIPSGSLAWRAREAASLLKEHGIVIKRITPSGQEPRTLYCPFDFGWFTDEPVTDLTCPRCDGVVLRMVTQ